MSRLPAGQLHVCVQKMLIMLAQAQRLGEPTASLFPQPVFSLWTEHCRCHNKKQSGCCRFIRVNGAGRQ